MPQIFSETKQKYIKKNTKCVVNTVREFEAFQRHNLSPLYTDKLCTCTCNSSLLFPLFFSSVFSLSFWIPLLSRNLKGFWGNTFPFIIAKTCWETFISKYQKNHTSANKKELHYNVIFQDLDIFFSLKELRVCWGQRRKVKRETLSFPAYLIHIYHCALKVFQLRKENYYAKNLKVPFSLLH